MPLVLPLIALDLLVVVLWVIAIALLISVIMGYVSGVLHGLPFPINQLAGPVDSLARGISNVCGKAIHLAEAAVGAAWHALARYLDTLWHTIEANAHIAALLAEEIGGQLAHVTGLSSLVHRLEKAWHGIEHGIKSLTREWHGIDRRVAKLERELAKGIGNDVRSQVKALEREFHRVTTKTIPAIESGVTTAENEVTQLSDYIANNFVTEAELATAATAATILAAGGLSWLRCNSNPFSNNHGACGLWSQLAKLLPLGVLLGLGFDFPEFVKAGEIVAEGIGAAVAGIEGVYPLALDPLPPPS